MLRGLAWSIVKDEALAEDTVQEVMLDLWRRRAELTFSVSPRQYLRGAVFRLALKKWNQQKRMQPLTADQVPEASPEIADEVTPVRREALRHCLETLPPRSGLVFRLARQEGLTHKEIAEHLDISPKTVENQMLRAFRLLRECVRKQLSPQNKSKE